MAHQHIMLLLLVHYVNTTNDSGWGKEKAIVSELQVGTESVGGC